MSTRSCSQHHSLNRIHHAFFCAWDFISASDMFTFLRHLRVGDGSQLIIFLEAEYSYSASWWELRNVHGRWAVIHELWTPKWWIWSNHDQTSSTLTMSKWRVYIYTYIYSLYKCLDIWDSGTNWVGFRRVLPWKQLNEGFFEAGFSFRRWWCSDIAFIHLCSPVYDRSIVYYLHLVNSKGTFEKNPPNLYGSVSQEYFIFWTAKKSRT